MLWFNHSPLNFLSNTLFTISISFLFICSAVITINAQSTEDVRGFGNTSGERNGKRLAIVIGNADYKIKPLNNPVNDAKAISSALQTAGFTVETHFNLNKAELDELISAFGQKLSSPHDIGLIYYAGHGIQVKGNNFLIPVNFDISRVPNERLIDNYSTSVDFIIDTLDDAKNNTNILILDACRDNPFESRLNRSSTVRGLAPVKAKKGIFIAYSTEINSVASDGSGRLSPYASALANRLKHNGQNIFELFSQVSSDVLEATGGEQRPWSSYSSTTSFCVANCGYASQKNPGNGSTPLPQNSLTSGSVIIPTDTRVNASSSSTSSTTSSATHIAHGPSIKKEIVYLGENKDEIRFSTAVIDCNDVEEIKKKADDLGDRNETHIWDNNWYYASIKSSDEGLLLAWTNITMKKFSWIFVQRNSTGTWFYRVMGGEWKEMKRGNEYPLNWTSNGTKIVIYLKAPNLTGNWNSDDIQYRFGW